MSKKKESQHEGGQPAPEASSEASVMVLSQRLGAVKCPCGTVIGHQDVVSMPAASAEWLEASFKGQFRRVK
jgi:hypothetical protein